VLRERSRLRGARVLPSSQPRHAGRDSIIVAAEAWRRADAGELADEVLYPSDAQWSGLYDRMHTHEPDEMERRLALAADYGDGFAE
jgi:hypothetical protein